MHLGPGQNHSRSSPGSNQKQQHVEPRRWPDRWPRAPQKDALLRRCSALRGDTCWKAKREHSQSRDETTEQTLSAPARTSAPATLSPHDRGESLPAPWGQLVEGTPRALGPQDGGRSLSACSLNAEHGCLCELMGFRELEVTGRRRRLACTVVSRKAHVLFALKSRARSGTPRGWERPPQSPESSRTCARVGSSPWVSGRAEPPETPSEPHRTVVSALTGPRVPMPGPPLCPSGRGPSEGLEAVGGTPIHQAHLRQGSSLLTGAHGQPSRTPASRRNLRVPTQVLSVGVGRCGGGGKPPRQKCVEIPRCFLTE